MTRPLGGGEGGEILDRVELDLMPFACVLSGPDGRTLFIMAADWHMGENPADNMARLTTGPRTGRVLTVQVPHRTPVGPDMD